MLFRAQASPNVSFVIFPNSNKVEVEKLKVENQFSYRKCPKLYNKVGYTSLYLASDVDNLNI